MGQFFGFKLHIIINDVSQIIAIKITKGNIDDRKAVAKLTKKLKSSIYADLLKSLYKKNLKLITGIRKNIKTILSIWQIKNYFAKNFVLKLSLAF